MATNNNQFAIDDALGVADNLDNYAKMLRALDQQLGEVLASHLPALVSGQALDTSAIWNALYAAIALKNEELVDGGMTPASAKAVP